MSTAIGSPSLTNMTVYIQQEDGQPDEVHDATVKITSRCNNNGIQLFANRKDGRYVSVFIYEKELQEAFSVLVKEQTTATYAYR